MHEITLPFKKLGYTILDALFPAECPICGNLRDSLCICESCNASLSLLQEDILEFELYADNIRIKCAACFTYKNDAVKKLLFYMKNNDSKRITAHVAMKMSACVNKLLSGTPAVFTNVPRSLSGMIKYGFDQSENMARKTADMYENALFCKLLCRKGLPKQQKKLTSLQRERNIKGKIRAIKTNAVSDFDSIVIFDDVVTTGSSVMECAKQLHSVFPEKQIYAVFLATQMKKT